MRRPGVPGRSFAVLALAGVLCCSSESHANESLLLAGTEAGGGTTYAYLGVLLPAGRDSRIGRGWLQRYWLDWLRYRYEDVDTVRARAPGASAALGYHDASGTWRWALYGGLGYRNTDLDPDRPSADVRGSQTAPFVLGEIGRDLTPDWRFSGLAHVAFDPDSYWTRARIVKLSDMPSIAGIGVETVVQGDPNYNAEKLGVVLEGAAADNGIQINIKFGFGRVDRGDFDAYAGIELSRHRAAGSQSQ